jgi:hypothetical protein
VYQVADVRKVLVSGGEAQREQLQSTTVPIKAPTPDSCGNIAKIFDLAPFTAQIDGAKVNGLHR